MADDPLPIVNKTGSAVVAGFILVFAVAVIVWVLLYGEANNGHHATALSWSYTLIVVVLGAVGLTPLLAQLLPLVRTPGQK